MAEVFFFGWLDSVLRFVKLHFPWQCAKPVVWWSSGASGLYGGASFCSLSQKWYNRGNPFFFSLVTCCYLMLSSFD